MKLPFAIILSPILKPHLSNTRLFCQNPTFTACGPYTCVYSILGLCINVHHLRKHLGEISLMTEPAEDQASAMRNVMLVHDLRIITISMGLMQYIFLLFGCLTKNPSLFLPHLSGQLIVMCVKILNVPADLIHINMKSMNKFRQRLTAIAVMTFNWLQGFCAFRKYLCICDL